MKIYFFHRMKEMILDLSSKRSAGINIIPWAIGFNLTSSIHVVLSSILECAFQVYRIKTCLRCATISQPLFPFPFSSKIPKFSLREVS